MFRKKKIMNHKFIHINKLTVELHSFMSTYSSEILQLFYVKESFLYDYFNSVFS